MNKNKKFIAIILNRNLGTICDELRHNLLNSGISDVIIVDSSTGRELQSEFVNVSADDNESIKQGLRINRGFNIGLNYALQHFEFEWVFCFPVDTQIVKLELEAFELVSAKYPKIQAFPLLEQNDPYLSLMKKDLGLVWNIPEGPILLKGSFVSQFKVENKVILFDDNNFRAFLSFKELALRVYANGGAIGLFSNFLISEREDLLLNYFELMKTESFSDNKRLLIEEGNEWLRSKYGISDRWSFENLIRLAYEEFLRCNPGYLELGL